MVAVVIIRVGIRTRPLPFSSPHRTTITDITGLLRIITDLLRIITDLLRITDITHRLRIMHPHPLPIGDRCIPIGVYT